MPLFIACKLVMGFGYYSYSTRAPPYIGIHIHSSEIRGLRSRKCSSETIQNLLYFMYMKTHIVFFFRFSFRATLYFYLMNALVYVDIPRPGHSLRKNIKLLEMKNEKDYMDFLIHKI